MYEDPDIQQIQQTLTASRIVVGALIVACWGFGIAAYVYVDLIAAPANPGEILVPAIMAVYSLTVAPIVCFFHSKRIDSTETNSVKDLCQFYQGKTIIWNASIEGACFANIVAYFVSGLLWSMIIAGAGLLLMMTTFPTETNLKHFIETHRAFE